MQDKIIHEKSPAFSELVQPFLDLVCAVIRVGGNRSFTAESKSPQKICLQKVEQSYKFCGIVHEQSSKSVCVRLKCC